MQLKALMYFDELVRTNSMRAAAEKLNVAPTAISRQIENLEEHFGAQLLERSNRGVKLTAAGVLVAERAGRTLREFEHVQQLIDDLKGLQSGEVSIFTNGAAVGALIAPVLAEFSLQYPQIRFSVVIASASGAMEALASAEADIAVTLFAPASAGVAVRRRLEVTYDAILPAAHAAAGRASLTPAEFAALPLALPDKSFAARQAFDQLFAAQGLVLNPAFSTGSLEMLKELVLRGAAATLLPVLSVRRELEAGLLAAVPLSGGAVVQSPIDLCVAEDRPLSFAAGRLADFIERFMRQPAE